MNSAVVAIILLSCALVSVLLGIIFYCYRTQLGNKCGRMFRHKRKVHQITVPARPSGENEIVLAVTQRRENVSRNGSFAPKASTTASINAVEFNTNENSNFQRLRPPHRLLTRHHSFIGQQSRQPTFYSWSDMPSPLVSLSSLQSLLMSSQVAIFDSSTERLSLSSQNQTQLPFQPISSRQQQNQIPGLAVGGASSPFSISPTVSSSCIHLPQPSYFDEPPPSYQESLLIRKLRASEKSLGNRVIHNQQQHPDHFSSAFNSSSGLRFANSRLSCRM